MKKVKIADIAMKSGVSLTTVSRFFNRPNLLSLETRKRIESVIQELNYSQNHLASTLVTGESNLVGAIFPHLHLSFYTELLNQLIKKGREKGYSFIVYTSHDSREQERKLIQELLSYQIKALVQLSHVLPSEEVEMLQVPVIAIERAGGHYYQINNDNFTGGKLAGNLLIAHGCDVFIHVNDGYHEDWPSFRRILGFEFAVRGKPTETIVDTDMVDPYSEAAAHAMGKLVNRLLSKYPGKKLGIFCSNDDLANLMQRECIKHDLRFPDQIELIGYDNSPVSNYAVYPITSVDQNIPTMAQIAVDAIDNYLPHESIVPATLIEKDTTGHPLHR